MIYKTSASKITLIAGALIICHLIFSNEHYCNTLSLKILSSTVVGFMTIGIAALLGPKSKGPNALDGYDTPW